MSDIRLPYVPGIPPPEIPSGPAVGFSPSSGEAQTAPVTAFGKNLGLVVVQHPSGNAQVVPTAVIAEAYDGIAWIRSVGGAIVWLAFTDSFTYSQGFQLKPGEIFTLSPVTKVWAQCFPHTGGTFTPSSGQALGLSINEAERGLLDVTAVAKQ